MRKHIISQPADSAQQWLDIDALAQVEVTSEDAAHPIESALEPGSGAGWRAAMPGEQFLRLLFDEPQKLRRIHLVFREEEAERTQEFVLRWFPRAGEPPREIVRQQFHFSPPGTSREVEDYNVALDNVAMLELVIKPHIGGGDARASLAELRVT